MRSREIILADMGRACARRDAYRGRLMVATDGHCVNADDHLAMLTAGIAATTLDMDVLLDEYLALLSLAVMVVPDDVSALV